MFYESHKIKERKLKSKTNENEINESEINVSKKSIEIIVAEIKPQAVDMIHNLNSVKEKQNKKKILELSKKKDKTPDINHLSLKHN